MEIFKKVFGIVMGAAIYGTVFYVLAKIIIQMIEEEKEK